MAAGSERAGSIDDGRPDYLPLNHLSFQREKFFARPLELFFVLTIFLIAARWRPGCRSGPELRRAPEGVRCQLVPNLLCGGFGYEV